MESETKTFCISRQHSLVEKLLLEGASQEGRPVQFQGFDPSDPNLIWFSYRDSEEIARVQALPWIKKWFVSLRAISLTATATPCLIILLAGYLSGYRPQILFSALALIAVLLAQMAINVYNDVEDHLLLVDDPKSIGGSGVIAKGWFSARQLRRHANFYLALGVIAAAPILISGPKELYVVLLLALIGVIGYSGAPFRFKYRAMGDVVVILLCGPLLTAGYSYAAFGSLFSGVLGLGLILGIAADAILHANNLNDLEADRSRGAYTLAAKIGFKKSRMFLYALLFGIPTLSLLLYFVNQLPLGATIAALGSMVFYSHLIKKVSTASGPLSPQLADIRFLAAQFHLGLGVLMLLGLFGVSLF